VEVQITQVNHQSHVEKEFSKKEHIALGRILYLEKGEGLKRKCQTPQRLALTTFNY